MRDEMDKRIKAQGVLNANFPLLIPIDFFNREAQHVAGFAKEAAVVTHYRLKMIDGSLQPDPESKLTDPYIIRPTSETIIGEAMSHWVQSYRDLPMKLNQWVNVMRWEMRPRMFLRTSEFNWQEGHNVFATHEEANADARKMYRLYGDYMRDVLAIPSIMGKKRLRKALPVPTTHIPPNRLCKTARLCRPAHRMTWVNISQNHSGLSI